jgi:hypothetical protein
LNLVTAARHDDGEIIDRHPAANPGYNAAMTVHDFPACPMGLHARLSPAAAIGVALLTFGKLARTVN